MCGIFGVVNTDITYDKALECTNRVIHRGPDGYGIFQESKITLGQRRLAILDLSDKGSQPMKDKSGRYILAFNGEIYNFVEIRRELEGRGYQFFSESDSEVLLNSYIEWGEDCQMKFNGMWAFSIWDRKKRELFISRDRFGVKPFYYTVLDESSHAIAFGSEMKTLTPLMKEVKPNRRLVLDGRRIVYYESTEECVIEGIQRLPAGHCGIIDENGIRIKRWWNTLDHLVSVPGSYKEQTEAFRELFLDAVKLRMRSDVTIGTALSGGVDSSAVICSMAHLSGNNTDLRVNTDWQHAYVATFPGTTMDESKYAKCVTDYLNIPSTFVEIDPLKALSKLDDYVYLFEDIYLTSPIPMMMLYGAMRENKTIVTIDGHGADELFGGYTFDFIHALKDAKSKQERDWILTAYIDSFPKDGSNMALKNTSKAGVYFNYLKRSLKDYLRSRSETYKKSRATGDERYEKMDTLNKILYSSSHETILPTLFRNYDRYSMANGIEIRMPFMDYRIVTFAMSLGFASKVHGGYSKSIVRDACAPFMPNEIAYRKTKIGFNTPIVEWMQGPLKEYFFDIINSSDFASCDLIDSERVKSLVMGVINNDAATFAMGEQAFSALYPYLWEKNVIKRQS